MRDTFSFLPWITLNTKKIDLFAQIGDSYLIEKNKREETTTTHIVTKYIEPTTSTNVMTYMHIPTGVYGGEIGCTVVYEYCLMDGDEDIPENRFYQTLQMAPSEEQPEYDVRSDISTFIQLTTTETSTVEPMKINTENIEKYTVKQTTLPIGQTILSDMSGTTTTDPRTERITRTDVWSPTFYRLNGAGENDWTIGILTEGRWGGDNSGFYSTLLQYLVPQAPYSSGEYPFTDYEGTGPKQFPVIAQPHKRFYACYQLDETGYNRAEYGGDGLTHPRYVETTKEQIDTHTTIAQNVTQITSGEDTRSQVLPNIDLTDDEKFYILDGTTAEVSIGPQEIIKGTIAGDYLFNVSEYTTFTKRGIDEYKTYYGTTFDDNNIPTGCTMAKGKITTVPNTFLDEWLASHRPDLLNRNRIWCRFITPVGYESLTFYQLLQVAMSIEVHATINASSPPPGWSVTGPIPKNSGGEEAAQWYDLPSPEPTTNEYGSNDSTLVPGTTSETTKTTETIGPINVGERNYNLCCVRFNGAWVNNYIIPPYQLSSSSDINWIPYPQNGFLHNGVMPTYRITGGEYCCVWALDDDDEDGCNYKYVENGTTIKEVDEETQTIETTAYKTTTITEGAIEYHGNVRLSFTWNNLPMVVMSPIASIVLTLTGMQIDHEIQPINIVEYGGSSLTAVVPVIENFYSMASTLRDLHDELVVSKDSFDDTATYTLSNNSGQERVIQLSAKFITKDGTLHQIFIPPKGVFSVQLTFGTSFYIA